MGQRTMKRICSICDLLGLVCLLIVTKPVIGYSLLQSTTSSKASSAHFRRNEERQQIHDKEPRCFVNNISNAINAQRRSDQNVAVSRTLPIQGFTARHRHPVKERPITPRQEISQFLRPPPLVPSNQNTNAIYFTTATPISGTKLNNQAFRPASPLPWEFTPPSSLVSPVTSAVHRTGVTSTTASPALSLGSYYSGSHKQHIQKVTHHTSSTGTSHLHASTQNGNYQQSTVVTVPRPAHYNQPGPQQRPSSVKHFEPISNDNPKQSHSINTFEHVNTPEKISGQVSSTPLPDDSKQDVNIPQADSIKRETYRITKPVIENNSDSKLSVPKKPENGQNSTQQKRQDLKLSGNELGYFYPGVQTPGPLGQLGLAPYGVDFVHLEEHHNPIENSLLVSSMWNSGLGLGLGGAGNVGPNRYGTHLYGRDPIVNLLLKNYAKYLPYGLGSYGLYSYSAPSHIDNSRPFGLYKYEDRI